MVLFGVVTNDAGETGAGAAMFDMPNMEVCEAYSLELEDRPPPENVVEIGTVCIEGKQEAIDFSNAYIAKKNLELEEQSI